MRDAERGLVPIDVWSLKRYGAERWLEERRWPVPDREGHALVSTLSQLFVQSVTEGDPEHCDLFLACYKLILECWHVLHGLLLIARLRDGGEEPLCDPRTPYLPQLVQSPGVRLSIESPRRMPIPSTWRRVAARLVTAWHDVRNGLLPVTAIPGFEAWPELGSWGYPSSAHRCYARRADRRIGLIHPLLWVADGAKGPATRHPSHQAFGELLAGRIRDLARRSIGGVDPEHADLLQRIVFRWVDRVAGAVGDLQRRIPSGKSTILATSLGKSQLKCFSVAARRRGHEIVGFPHGHFGHTDAAFKAYNEFAVVDRYVAPTPTSGSLFRRIQEKYPFPAKRRMQVETVGLDELREQWLGLRGDPVPDRIRSLMFLEFPLAPHRFQVPYSYWVFQFELITRVAREARRRGYRTILKRHPDRLAESEGLYDGLFDEQIVEPFEQTYGRADAFFFSDLGSTTFTFAIMTSRPVLVLERTLDTVWEDVRASLRTRCRVVDSWLDDAGWLQFDEAALAAALEAPPERPDSEFVETVLVSEAT